jgi:hypothetical protein
MAKAAHRSLSEGGLKFQPAGYGGRPFNHQTRGNHHDNHSSIRAEVATCEAAKAHTAKIKNRQQEGPTGPPNAAEHKVLVNPVSGKSEPGRTSTPRAYVMGDKHDNETKGETMKPVIRYQSQLLFRKSYKPDRWMRVKPAKLHLEFRPVRFGVKPQIKITKD